MKVQIQFILRLASLALEPAICEDHNSYVDLVDITC